MLVFIDSCGRCSKKHFSFSSDVQTARKCERWRLVFAETTCMELGSKFHPVILCWNALGMLSSDLFNHSKVWLLCFNTFIFFLRLQRRLEQLAISCFPSWWWTSIPWKWAVPSSLETLWRDSWWRAGCWGSYHWVCYIHPFVWKTTWTTPSWSFPWWTYWGVYSRKYCRN